MEEKKSKINLSIAVIVLLIALMIFCFVKINNLSEEISSLRSSVYNYQNQIRYLSSEINSIYNNIDTQLKKEASLLSTVDYVLGELDTETNAVSVDIAVVPKVLSDDMKLSVKIGDETFELLRNGNEFLTTVSVDMFMEYGDYPMLNIVSGEVTKTEKLEDIDISGLYLSYLPSVYGNFESSDEIKKGKLTVNGILMVDEKSAYMNSTVTITKLELITVKNDVEINRIDITTGNKESSYSVPINASCDVKYGDELCIYALAKDSLEYTHKIPIYFWNCIDEDSYAETTVVDGCQIYDKNGNLMISDY